MNTELSAMSFLVSNGAMGIISRMAGGQVGQNSSDEDLAALVSETGDRAAFNFLIQRYRVRVTALAKKLLQATPDDAEDAAQEAFVAAYEKRSSYKTSSPYRPWLYRIVINRCYDRLRSKGRRPSFVELNEAITETEVDADPLHLLMADEERSAILQAIDKLPLKYKTVFLLRHMDDLSYEDIGRSADIPTNTVKTHLFRARALLREALSGPASRTVIAGGQSEGTTI